MGLLYYSSFSFICMFCRSLFVLLYFFFWPLCCLFFFDIRILNTPLVSLNSSSYNVYKIPLYSTNHIAKYDNEIFDNHSEVKGNNENKVQEEFEDTKGVFRIRISKKDRQHNGQKKRTKGQITIYKTYA